MNIFEDLGLPANHRSDKKVTQLVKHFDEVTEKNKADKTFGVQTKKDGVCALFVVYSGMCGIYSRTGKRFTNVGQLESDMSDMYLVEGVYMGELYVPKSVASLEALSGIVNPNRVNPISADQTVIASELRFAMFDFVGLDDFKRGNSSLRFYQRFNNLKEILRNRPAMAQLSLLSYKTLITEGAIDKELEKQVQLGEEGIVIRDLDAGWVAGHKGYRVMKKVRGVDYDLRCIGFEEGTGKYAGKVANLIFDWKGGKTIKCMLGKGWTHGMAKHMFKALTVSNFSWDDCQDSPIGRIFQVYALEESSKGKLRLPKVGELRHDKDYSDLEN
jgi:ATP-dependent DNA ligase